MYLQIYTDDVTLPIITWIVILIGGANILFSLG